MKKLMFWSSYYWIAALLTFTFVLSGCATGPGGELVVNEAQMTQQQMEVLVGMAVREIACEVARIDEPELTEAIINVYTTAKEGQMTDDAMDQLSRAVSGRPTLGPAVGDLVELFGQPYLEEHKPYFLTESMYIRIERSWEQGFRMCGGGVPIPGPLLKE